MGNFNFDKTPYELCATFINFLIQSYFILIIFKCDNTFTAKIKTITLYIVKRTYMDPY
jgi:hypothetical protein